jgi:hypothetical protein
VYCNAHKTDGFSLSFVLKHSVSESGYFPFLEAKCAGGGDFRGPVRLSWVTLTETEILNQLTDFAKEETLPERFVTGGYPNDTKF